MTILLSDMLVGTIFKMFGLYNYSSDTVLISVLIPFVFYAVSYIIAGKMKRVTPRVLVTE
ncbi:MAG: hypothetical protein E7270_11380 [Lachnospiraceae bacterium]|nr:hypothetical protein [Lachnospiraceae bacterium]